LKKQTSGCQLALLRGSKRYVPSLLLKDGAC
jgi:hypothetical protein